MIDRIAHALTALFEKHRILFWYDAEEELRAEFDALDLPGVIKLEIANNEYAVKYRILREEPGQKFLLYHEGPQPEDMQNWLLDVLLAHGEFRADQVGILLAEMELGLDFADVVREHRDFFQAAKRKEALKKLIKPDDSAQQIRMKMLAVCAAAGEARMDAVLENLLQELAEDADEKMRLIERTGLAPFFWRQTEEFCGYRAKEPSMRDFAVELFKSCYALALGGQAQLSGEAQVFLKRWKDNRKCKEAFTALSERYAHALGIADDLEKREYRELLEVDYFRVIDQKIISILIRAVAAGTISQAELDDQVRLRRQSIWHEDFLPLYEAVACAAQFLRMQELVRLDMESPEDGVERYCRSWFQMDQLYRRFNCYARISAQPTLLGGLADQIEKLYVNNFVLKLGNRFQELVGKMDVWKISSLHRQDEFFAVRVQPVLRKDNKICVIISDALRYEIAEELQRAVRQEDRYAAELSPMLSMLPSYTQLGMAALLPHTELAVADNESGAVLLDGRPSAGTENRSGILHSALQGRGCAVTAEGLLSMGKEELRELLKAHDVLYIYHNRIDAAAGVKEDAVFEAAQETIRELIRLIKKLAGNNVSNVLVTADHGFLCQSKAVDESDFSDVDIQGEQILYKSRRFAFGRGLIAAQGVHTFTSGRLGLAGDIEVQIPKSIHRLRLKGAGSRYVHGGASLQEVIVPVLHINKKRQSDTAVVTVEILGASASSITSGQLAVTMYQREPVTDKMRPRTLRAGIYTEEGELISDSHELLFDRISENPRDREQVLRFLLTREAAKVNGKEVLLRLDEKLAGTSHYQEYASRRYIMRRSFTSDFDF